MVKKTGRVLSWLVPLAVAVVLGLMLSIVLHRLDVGAEERDEQAAEISALQAGLDEANARLANRGEEPVPVPEVGGSGAVPVLPLAPSQEQILAAFDVWCEENACRGEDGDDAPRMTQAEIFEGFSTWCSTDPRCVGDPGEDGKDSTAPGPPGRPPTAEEVLAAVQTVCQSSDLCRGIAGRDGAKGEPGRGVAKVECHTTGDWIITYTDGTAGTTPGPCRATQPTPAPSTTKGR